MTYDRAPCSNCWHYLLIDGNGPFVGPAPEVVQEAMGGEPASLWRFFEPGDVVTKWTLPLARTFGTAAEWRTVAGWWRETRERRDDRYLSLDEINAAWESER